MTEAKCLVQYQYRSQPPKMRNMTRTRSCSVKVLASGALIASCLPLLLGTGTVLGQRSDEIDLDTVIAGILGSESSDGTTTVGSTTIESSTAPVEPCPSTSSLCVPFHLCGDGKLTDNRLDLTNANNPCPYTHKCCPFADIHEERVPMINPFPVLNDTTTSSSSTAATQTQEQNTPSSQTTAPSSSSSSSSSPPVVVPIGASTSSHTNNNTPRCGVRNKVGLSFRIDNARDHESEFAEFPWMVALFEETEVLGQKSNVYKCGGSLIHPRVVLTATHCVNKKRNIVARAGEWDTQTDYETIPSQNRRVSEIVLHEKFHRGGLFNDIALLILETPIDMADNVGFVCLPKQGANFDTATCTASGWGSHSLGGMEQTILKKVDLPIVPHATCQDLFRTLRKTQDYDLHESYLCAGGQEGKDVCKGDGGSPLVCPVSSVSDQYVQAGVVSWGRGCGNAQVPGVYANVAQLRGWIDTKMSERRLESFYYDSY